jgi:hypothetical protein
VNQGTGRARFHVENLAIPDFHDFFNAVSPAPTTVPGHVSFEVTWAGGGGRTKVRDASYDFGGDYMTGPVTITFSVSNDGGPLITSDPDGQTNVGPPGVGHERNGVFFV